MQARYLTATADLLLRSDRLRRYPGLRRSGAPDFPRHMNTTGLTHGAQLQPFRGPVFAGAFDVCVDYSSIFRDTGATASTVAGAYALVSVFNGLTQRNLIHQNLSRKLVHILSGLLFMASWPLFRAKFSDSTGARYFASVVPLLNCFRLLVHGLHFSQDEVLIKSVTRNGKREELLRGPLFYVLILIICALVFWRDSPVGVVAVAMMCGGDGTADIIGRRFGSAKFPYNQQKSWAGSIAMFVFGFLISMGMLGYFSALGYFDLDWMPTMERVALVSLVATVVESIPTNGMVDDNISVPLASMLIASLCFGFY
ncbi:unnamed protein product [Cuscuta epithymum]|uniref:phytol kinase n=2 Tax=Cuscuta epithymum TaxID=186058 RepID=A0AAV0DFZ1_9ASTE|nr:unnamed protein product [Cuscuta epithymum]